MRRKAWHIRKRLPPTFRFSRGPPGSGSTPYGRCSPTALFPNVKLQFSELCGMTFRKAHHFSASFDEFYSKLDTYELMPICSAIVFDERIGGRLSEILRPAMLIRAPAFEPSRILTSGTMKCRLRLKVARTGYRETVERTRAVRFDQLTDRVSLCASHRSDES